MRSLLWNGFERYQVSDWAGQGCVLSDLDALTHFVFLTTVWDRYCYCPSFVPTKTEVQERKGTCSVISQITRRMGIHRKGGWGPELVFLSITYLREGTRFSYRWQCLSPAEGNGPSFLIAWSNFRLRKCRYGFFLSDHPPLERDAVNCVD